MPKAPILQPQNTTAQWSTETVDLQYYYFEPCESTDTNFTIYFAGRRRAPGVIDMFYLEARSGLVPVDEFFFTRGSTLLENMARADR